MVSTNGSTQGAPVQLSLRRKYTRNWPAYNAAQAEEKPRFMELLSDLCQHISEPEYIFGRPRLSLSDMVFSVVYKVYSGFASRRFTGDLTDAQAKGFVSTVPHFTSVNKYLSDPDLAPILTQLITLSSTPLAAVETNFAIDTSGFSTSQFMRWYDHKWGRYKGRKRDRREWVKVHIMCGVQTNIVTGAEVTGWRTHDNTYFEPLLNRTAEHFQVGEVSADMAYLSRRNLDLVDSYGGTPYIPFKSSTAPAWHEDSVWGRMYYRFMWDRQGFMQHYHLRSNVESTFSAIKAKFGNGLRSKSRTGQVNEALCKVLAHNICTIIKEVHVLEIEPTFSSKTEVEEKLIL